MKINLKQRRSHEENSKLVCLICMQKKTTRPITNTIQHLITQHWLEGLDFQDLRLPKGVCINCRSELVRRSTGDGRPRNIPDPSKFITLIIGKPLTRGEAKDPDSKDCECHVCLIGRSTPFNSLPTVQDNDEEKKASKGTSNGPPLLCSRCGSVYGRGYSHSCTPGRLANNLMRVLPQGTKEQITSGTLKEKDRQQPGKSTLQLKTMGPPLSIPSPSSGARPKARKSLALSPSTSVLPAGPQSFSSQGHESISSSSKSSSGHFKPSSQAQSAPVMTTEFLAQHMRKENLSISAMRRYDQSIKKGISKNSVEKGAARKVESLTHSEDHFFHTCLVKMNGGNGVMETKSLVVVKDVTDYVLHSHAIRNLDIHETELKIGIDSGQSFLKVCVSLIHKPEDSSQKQSSVIGVALNVI